MSQDTDIAEVSDPRDMTIDNPPAPEPHFQILKGDPSLEEIAALDEESATILDNVKELVGQ